MDTRARKYFTYKASLKDGSESKVKPATKKTPVQAKRVVEKKAVKEKPIDKKKVSKTTAKK